MTSWNLSSIPVHVFTDFIGGKVWRFPLDNANKTQPASATLRRTEPYHWMLAGRFCCHAGQSRGLMDRSTMQNKPAGCQVTTGRFQKFVRQFCDQLPPLYRRGSVFGSM